MAVLEAVLSGAHFLPQPRWLSQGPRRGSQGVTSCWHSGVVSTPLSPRCVVPCCVSVSPLDDSHRGVCQVK